MRDKGSAEEKTDPFEPQELGTLLASDLQGHLHWLAWLGLYTGARLNELCQLTKVHVRRHDGIHYLYFSPELRLKTREKKSCIRSVPIHSELIRRGFLDYVAGCSVSLFPGLSPHKTGRLSHEPSKAFSRHLRDIGIKRPKLSFKSLRKTFSDRLMKLAPRDFETRERLVGHATKGVAAHYRGRYEAEANDMDLLVSRVQVIELVKF